MKSKTKIEKQIKKKTNSELVETIILAKKNPSWGKLASLLSGPTRKQAKVNLDKIEKKVKDNEVAIIPGKVLGGGEINKKIRIAALGFSKEAEKKLKAVGCEIVSLKEEIKKNKKAEGTRILR